MIFHAFPGIDGIATTAIVDMIAACNCVAEKLCQRVLVRLVLWHKTAALSIFDFINDIIELI